MGSINYESNINKKIAFICIKGLDSFIKDIQFELSKDYTVKEFLVETANDIDAAIEWGDIIWLEWCNESSIIACRNENIKYKKVIMRIHGYEIFSDYPVHVNLDVVSNLIFVAAHKREIFFEQFGNIIDFNKTCIIRNGIDLNKYFIPENKVKNKNIAFVGNINYRKGLETLIQFFYELVNIDSEYKLYIRGDYQDLRLKIYDEQIIKELNLKNNIIFVERVENLNDWYKDMTYIVSSSIEESFQYTIGEGMLAGLKPVIHCWRESRDIWPSKYIYRNKDEFINIILSDNYNPEEYREYVKQKYSLSSQIDNIKNLVLK